MIAITRAQRMALLFASASAYIAWFSGFDGRLEAQGLVGAPTPMLTIVPRGAPPRVGSIIHRDPFDGAPRNPSESVAATAEIPTEREGRATELVTVPNISVSNGDPTLADTANSPNRNAGDSETLVVRATIVGRNPVAYVANGSAMDIVRVGDRLGDRRIGRIDLRGIAFSDGSRLDLPGVFIATPAPRKSGSTVTIKLADLRRLLLRPSAQTPPASPQNTVLSPTAPVSVATPLAPTYPTPGPLPTIDPRGIPVGTNPTPDANGPTPYPNPYPYAPPRR